MPPNESKAARWCWVMPDLTITTASQADTYSEDITEFDVARTITGVLAVWDG